MLFEVRLFGNFDRGSVCFSLRGHITQDRQAPLPQFLGSLPVRALNY